jgi:2-oxoisovalerate dehydrogenase E1 component
MGPSEGKVALFLSVYESILKSREVDLLEQDYTQRGEAFFHVSGSGHENIAFLNPHLIPEDYLHCHYRDKSLMIARGVTVRQFFLSLFAKDESHSRGRQMSAHLSDPQHKVLSLVGPVGNNALQAVGVASVIKPQAKKPLVLCALGEGTTQQGEVLEAIAHAVREVLPVLFVVEDNSWAISTKTKGRTFYDTPDGEADQFYGIPVLRIDGRDAEAAYEAFDEVVAKMRADRRPAIVVFQVKRLNSHTNADDQRTYRTLEEIEETRRKDDPIPKLRQWLRDHGVAAETLDALDAKVKTSVLADSIEAQDSPDPQPNFDAKAPLPPGLADAAREYRGNGEGEQIVMLEAMREVLKNRLSWDPNVTLFGEDIEDPKGDVFGVTKGLSQAFPGRVKNSPLAESTIVGVAVGQALAGARPVGFLQFADFFAIAYNQIFAEMGSMYWRTDGGWTAPVILMVSCGGFKPGLGPFHASSMESTAAHTPGIDVFLPATAGDAAGLLNAAFESKRPTIIFYPKSCLNDRSQATSRDVARQLVAIGKGRKHRDGTGITFVCWGNTLNFSLKAADALATAGVTSDVIDLRSISPWDVEMVVESVRKTGKLIIAQEDNLTASVASEVAATVAERAGVPVTVRRVSRPDTYVPFHFENQLEVMPSYKKILTAAVEMLGGELTWKAAPKQEDGFSFVEAVGSSPSDESVTVLEWKVKKGDALVPGLKIAEMEADKAAFDLSCPLEGVLAEVLVPVGEMVKVGTPLLKVATGTARVSKKPVTLENPGEPQIGWLAARPGTVAASGSLSVRPAGPVAGIAGLRIAPGSRIVSNEEIAEKCAEWTPEKIVKSIGIESRHWATADENALTLATKAARELLASHKLTAADLTAVFCTTGTPLKVTPSMACLTLAELSVGLDPQPEMQAQDINSACSGYLYGLQAAWDHLRHNPDGRVLVLTTEVLSRRTDPTDYQTAPIFGDAATATLVVGAGRAAQMLAHYDRPELSAKGENGDILRVPLPLDEYIFQDGPKVYLEAVKHMIAQLEKACAAGGVSVHDLDLVVAHQANQRILNAVRQRTKLAPEKVFSNIRHYGNTSSNSIPLALFELMPELRPGKIVGLCAFGGGFTFGGALLRTM